MNRTCCPLSQAHCTEPADPFCWRTLLLQEHAKACIIDCVLPTVVPAVAKALQLPAPLNMLTLLGFPGHVNRTLMPGLHPSCDGYTVMGDYIAKELFP